MRQGVGGAQAWKMGGGIRVNFDDILTIQCLEILSDPKLWREMAAKGRNPISKVTCQAHATSTFL